MFDRELVYDVGLHKGEDTQFYLKKGYRVIAIEANPELIDQCRVRFAEAIRSNRLNIIEGAIAPASFGESIKFFISRKKTVWGTITPSWVERNRGLGSDSFEIKVNRIDFHEVIRKHGVPLYMKIDIEGADSEVLQELKKTGIRPRFISIESGAVDFCQLSQDLLMLSELGYQRFKAVQQCTIPGSRLRCLDLNGREIEHVFPADSSGPFGEDLPGPWLDYSEIADEYRKIVRRKRLFGTQSAIRQIKGGWRLLRLLEKAYGRPLVGWHDTHAAL